MTKEKGEKKKVTATKIEEPAGYGYNLLMPRHSRSAPGGMVFHVLNRGVGRRNLFDKDGDFLAFERVLLKTLRVRRMRVCAWCLMSNHWHLVLWPGIAKGDILLYWQRRSD